MQVFPARDAHGEPADPERFTGAVRRTVHLPGATHGGLVGLRFDYVPGARSHWHVHLSDQALVVVEGRGLVDWEGSDGASDLEAGDWVRVVPGVPHWHGATADDTFSHLAATAPGETQWLGPVSDDDYRRAAAR